MLLLGLWYGRQKPSINPFLEKTLEDIDKIHENGGKIVLQASLNVIHLKHIYILLSRRHCALSCISQTSSTIYK